MTAIPLPPTSNLKTLRIRDAEYLEDSSGLHVYHVTDPHALIQAAGYLKFINGPSDEAIYFRGQTRLHASLSPTLFRDSSSQRAHSIRVNKLSSVTEEACSRLKIFSQFDKKAYEPLLQHYGFRTTWIDLVDNVWVSLWFSCHKARSTGRLGEYLHFEKRNPATDPAPFAYILLVAVDSDPDPYIPGFYKGKNTEMIDLRIACPSIFLRPHAQHGVLFRARGVPGAQRPGDYISQLRGVIRIRLDDALAWLGDGKMLGVHALFPPPYYDHGYSQLLASKLTGHPMLGMIAHIGA
ncbi:FRG domain-containing protein [Nitrospirillum amazonense]|uniref:FRG domain-containing protein n=1 Tax=Nitrospirillum amazonense TaxID=28077 RepID=UPI002DD43708|nr:FRG domain-containing protein [Nitrospirillum amazonense]MEC4592180.1 FRG domain-containing protein [Nitrospirillum amazonense]